MDDARLDDIAVYPALGTLLAAWQCPDPCKRRALLDGLKVPGPLALRSRYRQALDPQAPAGPWDPDLAPQAWQRILTLEHEADRAVRANDATAARGLFTELLRAEPSATHRVVTINALIGLGDVSFAADDAENALRQFELALEMAATDGYRFGRLRALTGLGYLTLRFHSAGAALSRFREASGLAAELDEILYAGNALLGVAECQERTGDLDSAVEHAIAAHHAFDRTGSALGVGNAAQRLGATLHRLGRDVQAREWYERACTAFIEAGNPMGLTNVLSGLGDLLLDRERDFDTAEQVYRESLRVAEAAGLRASRAHALQDLARVERARGRWADALPAFEAALAAYRDLDDILGAVNALGKIAEAHRKLGQNAASLRARMEAVFWVEEFRATHRDERSQREYRDRFELIYTHALEAATVEQEPAAFAVAADCLAGRRLAGLFAETLRAAGGHGELSLLQELLVRADQRLVEHRRGTGRRIGPEPQQERRERVIGLLGAFGVKHGLAEQAQSSLDDLLAAIYLPPSDEGDALLAALPDDCHVLQMLIDPVDAALARWLWRTPDGAVRLGATGLGAAAVELIAQLQQDGDERASLKIPDMTPLEALLPDEFRGVVSVDGRHRVIVIPIGELWLVPWSAVPVDATRVLGEAAVYVVCPSLTIQRQLAERGAPLPPRTPRRVSLWRSPMVTAHTLTGFRDDPAWEVLELASSAEAKERLRNGGDGAIVVTGHGRPAPGLGHYLELDSGEWLLPVDLVGARPPTRLCMIACWGGAVPGRGPTDPLSLATLALAAGSIEIIATVGELADTASASAYVERVLTGQAGVSLPEALHAATCWMLEHEGDRSDRIHHWAPLIPIGTLY